MTSAIGFVLLYLLAFWYLYLIVMGLYRAHLANRLSRVAFVLALPALVIGFLVDWVANWSIAIVVFMEAPEAPEELVTDRLRRYINGPSGWRKTRALAICEHLLDPFDPSGSHCK